MAQTTKAQAYPRHRLLLAHEHLHEADRQWIEDAVYGYATTHMADIMRSAFIKRTPLDRFYINYWAGRTWETQAAALTVIEAMRTETAARLMVAP